MLQEPRRTSTGKINQVKERGRTIIDRMMERQIRTDSQEKRKDSRYPCRVCNENTHTILLECPEFQRFTSEQPRGPESTPKEVIIRVQTESGLFPIVIIYDTGSVVSSCNYETGPVVANTTRGNKKVTISTINSMQAMLRKVY